MQPLFEPPVVLLKGPLPDLKRALDLLNGKGVPAEILRPPGCSTSS